MAFELDNFPACDDELYQSIQSKSVFPDEIMRKDVLDELQPYGSRVLPTPPLATPCIDCYEKKLSKEVCRLVNKHVDPPHKLVNIQSKLGNGGTEYDEYKRAVELLCANHKEHSLQESKLGRMKRNYKRWDTDEQYNLMLAINIFGMKDYHKIASVLSNRSENQIRTFILRNYSTTPVKSLEELVADPPAGYKAPVSLSYLFAGDNKDYNGASVKENDPERLLGELRHLDEYQKGSGKHSDKTRENHYRNYQGEYHGSDATDHAFYDEQPQLSQLAPRQGSCGWNSLLTIAASSSNRKNSAMFQEKDVYDPVNKDSYFVSKTLGLTKVANKSNPSYPNMKRKREPMSPMAKINKHNHGKMKNTAAGTASDLLRKVAIKNIDITALNNATMKLRNEIDTSVPDQSPTPKQQKIAELQSPPTIKYAKTLIESPMTHRDMEMSNIMFPVEFFVDDSLHNLGIGDDSIMGVN